MQRFAQFVYPVGSIVQLTITTNPATLWGFGEWESVQDRFLIGAGGSYANGATGGEVEHTLSINEMPSHTHTFNGTADSHAHNVQLYNSNNDYFTMATSGLRFDSVAWIDPPSTTAGSTGGDKAGVTTSTSITPKGTNTNTGGGAAHNNMPPYLAVYMWKRTA